MKSGRTLVRLFACLLAICLSFGPPAAADEMRSYIKTGMPYADVKLDLESAIEGRGLKIGAVGDLGDMLDRTRADLSAGPLVYKSAHYLNFCSAMLAHKLSAADPSNIGHCPFLMFIYETAAKPGEVVVGYRSFTRAGANPATRAVLDQADAMLDGIAREAVK